MTYIQLKFNWNIIYGFLNTKITSEGFFTFGPNSEFWIPKFVDSMDFNFVLVERNEQAHTNTMVPLFLMYGKY